MFSFTSSLKSKQYFFFPKSGKDEASRAKEGINF